MPKDMSRDEVTSNSEKIRHIALAAIGLRLPEAGRRVGKRAGKWVGKRVGTGGQVGELRASRQ